jgi:hypothetical protein
MLGTGGENVSEPDQSLVRREYLTRRERSEVASEGFLW